MKTFKFTKIILALLVLGLSFNACKKDNPVEAIAEDPDVDVSQVVQSSDMDQVAAGLEDYIIEIYEEQETAKKLGRSASSRISMDCATVTLASQENSQELTIDFTNEGCTIRGHLYQGQIVLTYTINLQATQVTLDYVLNDFYFDDKNILGSNSIVREVVNEKPQFTHTVDLTVIWPNGIEATREGEIVRTWVEGFGGGVFTDNVFEVTGNWNATFANGNIHAYETVLPLRREASCYHFVSGSINVQRTIFSGTLDFGDGTCDNLATFSFANGTQIDIVLK